VIFRAVVGALVLLGLQSPAAATPCEKAAVVRAGVRAPCSGLVVPEQDARRALGCLSVALPRCEADLALCAAEAAANAKGAREMLGACNDHRDALTSQLESCLSVPARAWWDQPRAWFGGGVVIGAGVVVAIVYGMSTL